MREGLTKLAGEKKEGERKEGKGRGKRGKKGKRGKGKGEGSGGGDLIRRVPLLRYCANNNGQRYLGKDLGWRRKKGVETNLIGVAQSHLFSLFSFFFNADFTNPPIYLQGTTVILLMHLPIICDRGGKGAEAARRHVLQMG